MPHTITPHETEIDWSGRRAHPSDVLALEPDHALAEAYRLVGEYRQVAQAALDAMAEVTAVAETRRQRIAELTEMLRELRDMGRAA